MSEERREYNGIEIVVRTADGTMEGEEGGGPPGLFVDGRLEPATPDPMTGRVWHWQLPYQEFESPMQLGEALVDHLHAPGRED